MIQRHTWKKRVAWSGTRLKMSSRLRTRFKMSPRYLEVNMEEEAGVGHIPKVFYAFCL